MSESSIEYKNALDYTKKFQIELEGFSIYNPTLIKQNNTIIKLLLSLHEKIYDLETDIGKIKTEQRNLKLEKDLGDLTNKIETLSLDKTGKEKITTKIRPPFQFIVPKNVQRK